MKSCRNPGMETLRCQILPAPAAWGDAATPPAVPGVSARSCGDALLPAGPGSCRGSGKPHRISAPSRFRCQSGGTVAGPQPARRARLSRQWCSPGPAPPLTSEPRVLPGHLSGPCTPLRKETSTKPPGSCRAGTATSLKLQQQQQHPGCWEGRKSGLHLSGGGKKFFKTHQTKPLRGQEEASGR